MAKGKGWWRKGKISAQKSCNLKSYAYASSSYSNEMNLSNWMSVLCVSTSQTKERENKIVFIHRISYHWKSILFDMRSRKSAFSLLTLIRCEKNESIRKHGTWNYWKFQRSVFHLVHNNLTHTPSFGFFFHFSPPISLSLHRTLTLSANYVIYFEMQNPKLNT